MSGPTERTRWWVTELWWTGLLAGFLALLWAVGRASRHPVAQRGSRAPMSRLEGLWRSAVGLLPAGGWQRPAALVLVAVGTVAAVALLWRLTRPASSGILLGRSGPRLWSQKVWLSLRASCSHVWVLSPIGGGKTTLLANLILGEIRARPDPHVARGRHRRRRYELACRKLGPGRAVVAIDPNGALTDRVLSRLSPAERDRVVVIDPLDDDPPAINLFAAADPEQAADFIVSIFRALPGGGTTGAIQIDILSRALLELARRPGATLRDLPKHLQDTADDGDRAAVRGLVARLRPFFVPSIDKIIGRPESEDVFSAIDAGRCVIVRMRPELSRPAATLLAAVVLGRLYDRILRRVPDHPHRHLLLILDELGAVVRERQVLTLMLDQVRSRNVGVVCAHQGMSQLDEDAPGLTDALRRSALTRIVWRLSDVDEAAHMAKQLTGNLTAKHLTDLPDFTTYIRRRAKGLPLMVRMYDVPGPWRPPFTERLAARWKRRRRPLRRVLKALPRGLPRPPGPTPGPLPAGSTPEGVVQTWQAGRSDGTPTTPKTPLASVRITPSTSEDETKIPSVPLGPPQTLVPGLRLQPRDLQVLALLWDHGVATSDQLARAYWPTTAGNKAARLRLGALAKAGAVAVSGANGRPQQHYGLTAKGAAVLGRPWRPPRLDERAVEHRLAVVDFGSALLAAADQAGWAMRWAGEGEASAGVAPDSRIELETPAGLLRLWVEVDRGTESWSVLGAKLTRLLAAAAGKCDAIAVAFTAPGRASGASGRLPVSASPAVVSALLDRHIADPLGAVWTPAGAAPPMGLAELVSRAPQDATQGAGE